MMSVKGLLLVHSETSVLGQAQCLKAHFGPSALAHSQDTLRCSEGEYVHAELQVKAYACQLYAMQATHSKI